MHSMVTALLTLKLVADSGQSLGQHPTLVRFPNRRRWWSRRADFDAEAEREKAVACEARYGGLFVLG